MGLFIINHHIAKIIDAMQSIINNVVCIANNIFRFLSCIYLTSFPHLSYFVFLNFSF
nr:MAG TPA: hypothetical protein [Caudoviricetes sp.]